MSYVRVPQWRGRYLPFGADALYNSPIGMRRGVAVPIRPRPWQVSRGVGDILNPTAGSSLNCGLLHFGVFNPQCWALQLGPSIVGESNYQAAVALANPDLVYAPIQAPPPPGAPPASVMTTSPASAQAAAGTVSDILANEAAAWQAQNADTMAQTAANLDAIAASNPPAPPATNWLLWGGLAAVTGLAIVLVRR